MCPDGFPVACTVCPDGFFQTQCGPVSDGPCQKCEPCRSDRYIRANCGGTSEGTCTELITLIM